MNGALQNMIRLQVERVLARKISSRRGTVTSYDPNTYSVNVSIQPEGVATGFIPFAANWAGNGWGMYAPPSIGQQVNVIFSNGNTNAGWAESCFFTNADAPTTVQSGELWLLHAKGGFWPLLNHGEVAVLYCFVFLYLFFAGGGPLSVDGLIRRKA